jgi:hypothetical protein
MAASTARPASAGGKRSSAAALSPVIQAVRLVTSVGSSRLRAAASMPARVSVNKLGA